jgi:hypothetical protein
VKYWLVIAVARLIFRLLEKGCIFNCLLYFYDWSGSYGHT